MVVPFPFLSSNGGEDVEDSGDKVTSIFSKWAKHPAILKLSRLIDLERSCGYITMMNVKGSALRQSNSSTNLSLVPPSIKLPNLLEEDFDDSRGTDEDEDQIMFVSANSSAVSEPRNGFKDEKCANIYKEELNFVIDELEEAQNIPPQVYDSRKQKIESLRLDLTVNASGSVLEGCPSSSNKPNLLSADSTNGENNWYDDWTILDCHFGLPLFDTTVNQIVSERIVSNNLWEESRYDIEQHLQNIHGCSTFSFISFSLEQLVKSNQELGRQLTEFINTCQVSLGLDVSV